ncbi:hypothetical protein A8L34_05080 [Bacillus sp. FJAT-27264]|uniref:hypothetical protein n=1 Tax=Paenibacillus sp. (strain DSM 101736 / FJAT-27264) TaxID=1850362 RepID=UPI000807D49A|nr:hypothetical protein [Bacillus sp. FJAT-27264]OBZ18924.1 hypothetical protein A8L34_05080 [Bacillus sp. FJAT-27264]
MLYSAEEIQSFAEKIKKELGFADIMFDKQVVDDLYFRVWDDKSIEDRIRFKPSAGTLYTYYQGQWRQVPGLKI